MRYCQTSHCQDCIDRHIASTEEIMEVISDPHNHEEERRRLVELISARRRMIEEAARMGMTGDPYRPLPDEPDRSPLHVQVGDKVRVTSKEGWRYQGVLIEAQPVGADEWAVTVQEGSGQTGITVKVEQIERMV